MIFYKVKMSNGTYIKACGDTRKAQERDAQALAKRYGGKVIRIEAR